MPVGHRDRLFRSNPSHNDTQTLVERAMASSDTPRCRRIRRRFGPNDSRELMPPALGKIPTARRPSVLQGFPLVPLRTAANFVIELQFRPAGSVELTLRRRLLRADA